MGSRPLTGWNSGYECKDKTVLRASLSITVYESFVAVAYVYRVFFALAWACHPDSMPVFQPWLAIAPKSAAAVKTDVNKVDFRARASSDLLHERWVPQVPAWVCGAGRALGTTGRSLRPGRFDSGCGPRRMYNTFLKKTEPAPWPAWPTLLPCLEQDPLRYSVPDFFW